MSNNKNDSGKKESKKRWSVLGNILLVVVLALMIFSTDAKSWVLRQMLSVGLFKANIPVEAPPANQRTTFNFIDADGNLASTSDLTGKVVFINFWATWCPPCIAEMPSLEALYKKLKDDPDIVFLFINEDDDINKGNSFLQRNELLLPLARSQGGVPSEIFSGTLPTTVVLNKQGQIVLKKEGLGNYNTSAFVEQLKALR